MQFPDEISEEVLNRLRRAEGQLRGVQRLIEEGADCKKVLTQLNAAQAALHRAGVRLMAAGMRYCLADPARAEAEGMTPDEMEKLFLSLR
ncbi:MAG: metal-sensitive transcriptional regulator [Ilumatobacteraceae bacterium]